MFTLPPGPQGAQLPCSGRGPRPPTSEGDGKPSNWEEGDSNPPWGSDAPVDQINPDTLAPIFRAPRGPRGADPAFVVLAAFVGSTSPSTRSR